MTHSHDTSTPAMSAETVPSEDLARRAVAQLEFHGANNGVGYSPGILFRYGRSSSLFVSELDASTLSASHLAKEGGEAGAVGYLNRLVLADFDPNGTEIVSAMLYPKGTLHPQNEVAIYALPHPSPALAKEGEGAEAILWQEKRGVWKRPGAIVKHVRMSSGHMAWRATFDDGRHHHSDSADDAKAYADGFLAREQAEAFSTPTEGPASQTEGMGGDEGGAARLQLLLNMRDKFIVDAGLWEVFVASDASKGVGAWDQAPALTPPETAEAVEAAETRVMEFLVSRFGGHSVTVVRNGVGRLIGYSLGDDEHDAIAIRDLLDAAGPLHQPSVSDPAPATDDRERLVEALREARQWVEANTAQVRGLSLEAAAPGEAMLRKIDAALTKEASR